MQADKPTFLTREQRKAARDLRDQRIARAPVSKDEAKKIVMKYVGDSIEEAKAAASSLKKRIQECSK